MRSFKTILTVLLFAGSVVTSTLTYFQSHGAGIALALLCALVLFSFIFDNRHSLMGRESPSGEEIAAGSMALQRKIAMRHARSLASHEDGDIPAVRKL